MNGIVDKYCLGCVYLCYVNYGVPILTGKGLKGYVCDYIYSAGERRGCPAGAGCTKKKVGKRVKRDISIVIEPKEISELYRSSLTTGKYERRVGRPSLPEGERQRRAKEKIETNREEYKTSALKFSEWMANNGYTAASLSKVLGVTKNCVRRWQKGERPPGWKYLVRFGLIGDDEIR